MMPYYPPLVRADKIPRTIAGYRVTDGNIAAIDFGTTSVSLAYTTKGDKEIVTLPLEPGSKATRILNVILLKREGTKVKVEAFGENAKKKFQGIKPSDYSNYIYFERIKMLMKREMVINRQSVVLSFSGEKYYLVEVIAFILKYLKNELIDHLSRSVKPLKTTDFDWVITVPAIWDARGKRMMREAAYMAGLLTEFKRISEFTPISSSPLPVPDEVNPDKLSLALEPEAAALYCQETVQIKGQPLAAAISHPTEYMVIDAGGGTIDITAVIKKDGGIVVQNIPSDNAWGGTQVNEAFSKLLQEIVNDPGFEKFIASGDHTKNQTILNHVVYNKFEWQKMDFGRRISEEISVSLPKNFVQFYEKALVKKLKEMTGIQYEDDTLYIDESVVESKLFGPVIKGIIDCTLSAIERIGNCPSTFYLVGAFGGCKYVHDKVHAAIKRHHQSKGHKGTCSVLVPFFPQLAVATGAVMWRKNPEKFKARRVDATYGIKITAIYDPIKHNEAYELSEVCNVLLEPKGELVGANEVVVTTVTPERGDTIKMSIIIYSTSHSKISYPKNENRKTIFTVIGKLVIDVPNPNNLPLYKRQVDVTMDFTGTEIHAKARYRMTGKEVKTVCDI